MPRSRPAACAAARAEHPEALVAAHPECPQECWRWRISSARHRRIIDWCTSQRADEFIVMTESGVSHSLQQAGPGKEFYFVANENCNCSECPYMRKNTLEKLLACLETLEPRVELSARNDGTRAAADRANAGSKIAKPFVPSLIQLAASYSRHPGRSGIRPAGGYVRPNSRNLRISVTDRCNIRCFYCMPETGGEFAPVARLLEFRSDRSVRPRCRSTGVNEMRLTGGEPLLRPFAARS